MSLKPNLIVRVAFGLLLMLSAVQAQVNLSGTVLGKESNPIEGVAARLMTAGLLDATDKAGRSHDPKITSTTSVGAIAGISIYIPGLYWLTYNGNGATGGSVPTEPKRYLVGSCVTVLGNYGNLVRSGYTFTGWNTAANGSGSWYTAGSKVTIRFANVTLHAQWSPTNNPIVFNRNGGSGTMSTHYAATGSSVTLNANTFTRDGYVFTGWNTAANGSGTAYVDQARFTIGPSGMTLYAQWSPTSNAIIFNRNGGSGTMSTQYAATGSSVTLNANTFAFHDGYFFAGWNIAADGTGAAYANHAFFRMGSADITLYAQWIECPVDGDGNKYNVVVIDRFAWTVENLRTTKYVDGTAIPGPIFTNTQWNELSTPGYCWYNDTIDEADRTKYGALYNWYVVDPANPKQIAPPGWHVPDLYDASRLDLYGGGAKNLASNGGEWDSTGPGSIIGNNQETNNGSGFSGLPNGLRFSLGMDERGNRATWWIIASIDSGSDDVSGFTLYNDYEFVCAFPGLKSEGYGIRLVRELRYDYYAF